MKTNKTNNTVSNRVLLAEFDDNWKREVSDGHVVYTATSNDAEINLLIGGQTQTLVFKKGRQVFIVAQTFHFAPHFFFITS